MTDLPRCCQQPEIDGLSPAEHFPVCSARAVEPQEETLFVLPDQPKTGGPLL
jgi:hypothetical protein